MLIKDGVPTQEEIDEITPSLERREQGPVAVIECYHKIPCNPCYTACKFDSIKEFEDINDRPKIDYDNCIACGLCLMKCPGLAIFIIDESYSKTKGSVMIPYELSPLPEVGTYVTALNRASEPVCEAKVLKVQNAKHQNKTAAVTLEVPKEYTMDVRSFKIEDLSDDSTIICRCEGTTVGEVRQLIKEGYTSLDEIKRISRAGMGPCQGRTCRHLIMQEISRATGQSMEDIEQMTFRPPTKPIKFGLLLGGGDDE